MWPLPISDEPGVTDDLVSRLAARYCAVGADFDEERFRAVVSVALESGSTLLLFDPVGMIFVYGSRTGAIVLGVETTSDEVWNVFRPALNAAEAFELSEAGKATAVAPREADPAAQRAAAFASIYGAGYLVGSRRMWRLKCGSAQIICESLRTVREVYSATDSGTPPEGIDAGFRVAHAADSPALLFDPVAETIVYRGRMGLAVLGRDLAAEGMADAEAAL